MLKVKQAATRHRGLELSRVLLCVASRLLLTTVWEERRPAAGVLGEECCPVVV